MEETLIKCTEKGLKLHIKIKGLKCENQIDMWIL